MPQFLINPPVLNINQILYSESRPMPAHVRLEQRIVWNLLLDLEKAGFIPHSVNDGDEQTNATSKKAAMELLFNLDDAYLFLSHKSGEKMERDGGDRLRLVWVRFVFGNGVDVISDYNATDWQGFQGVLDKFDATLYA